MQDDVTIDVRKEEDKTTIACAGQLDLSNSRDFTRALNSAVEACNDVVVDFSETTFIDTAVLQDMASAGKRLLNNQKRLKVITREKSHPLRTLKIVGFHDLMEISVIPAASDRCD